MRIVRIERRDGRPPLLATIYIGHMRHEVPMDGGHLLSWQSLRRCLMNYGIHVPRDEVAPGDFDAMIASAFKAGGAS